MSEYRTPEEDTIGPDGDEESEPELLDAGPPAEDAPGDPEGSSGAEEGLSPLDDDSYADDPEGPSQVAGD